MRMRPVGNAIHKIPLFHIYIVAGFIDQRRFYEARFSAGFSDQIRYSSSFMSKRRHSAKKIKLVSHFRNEMKSNILLLSCDFACDSYGKSSLNSGERSAPAFRSRLRNCDIRLQSLPESPKSTLHQRSKYLWLKAQHPCTLVEDLDTLWNGRASLWSEQRNRNIAAQPM